MSPQRRSGSPNGKAETERPASPVGHREGTVGSDRRKTELQLPLGGAPGHFDSEDGSSTPRNWYTPHGGSEHALVSGSAQVIPGTAYRSGLRTGQQLQSAVFTADVAAFALAVVLLVLLAFVLFPGISSPRRPAPTGNPNRAVWVDTQSGLYFCPAAKLYGKGQGKYMTQRDAQMRAFKPALRAPCE
jgi:hypothetical protein